MRNFKENLLAQFSVVTFVIMVILALVVSVIIIEILNRNVDLLREHNQALAAGESISPADSISLPNLSRQVSNLKWITLGAIGGSFVYLYATLVYIVWEGWRTILKQRLELESSNAELETRVAERVEELREALGEGRRRLEAFRVAAGRLALEEVPERALQYLVDGARGLIGTRYGALAVLDQEGLSGKFVTSGFSPEQRGRMSSQHRSLDDLGLKNETDSNIVIGDLPRYLSAHGLSSDSTEVTQIVAASVVVQGRSTGVFYMMANESEPEFSEDDKRLLDLFAVLAGVQLENADLYDAVALERRTLAAIQSSMTEGLVVLDPAGKVMYLNDTAERQWDLGSDRAPGKHIKEVLGPKKADFESPDALGVLLDITKGLDQEARTIEVTLSQPQRRHMEVTAFPIPGAPEQTMTGLLARDVTQERELRERRNAFVSIASHELRTPMTTIMGFSELLLKRDLPEASRQQWVERIYQNSQILSAIVDDMLDVSRIQSGKIELSLERLDLYGIVEEVWAGIRPEGDEHQYVVSIPEDIPQVVADREKLAQVLMNLTTNAIKYSPNGGTITVTAHHEADREQVVVSISDQGIGIAPEEQEQLFSTFHRIRRPETEGIRGTGLGLSIVKGLVVMMRGRVWVESELNQGSSFFFTLPTKRVEMVEGSFEASRQSTS